MKSNRTLLLLVLAILLVAVNGRVYYLPSLEENRYAGSTYPIPNEQSSRDLDLSFLAGDTNEIDDKIRPVKGVYTVVTPNKPFVEVNKEELPITRYQLVEAPVKGLNNVLVVPESSRKSVKIDGNNRGEVILELRVIANHDTD